ARHPGHHPPGTAAGLPARRVPLGARHGRRRGPPPQAQGNPDPSRFAPDRPDAGRRPKPGCRGPLKPKATSMTDAILDRLMRLHPKLIDLELDRIERLLADVGSPHLKVPPVVHVARPNA